MENKKYVPDSLSRREKTKQRKILKERKEKAKKGIFVNKKLNKKKPKQSTFTTRFKKKYKLKNYFQKY